MLDANVLISASNTFYKMSRVPEYWDWLKHHGQQGNVKIPRETYEEIVRGKGDLVDWLKEKSCRDALLVKEILQPRIVTHILSVGYAPDLSDVEIDEIGRDPFLIAYAYGRTDRCVVTSEVSAISKKRQNRKIPDVCDDLNVRWISDQKFLDVLDFRTNWNA